MSTSASWWKIIARSKHSDEVMNFSQTFYLSCFLFNGTFFSGLLYNINYNDILYVIQNGSLLRIDGSFESFDIYDHYCLEMDDEEGVLTAIVCEFDDMLFRVNRAQAMIFATCMIISVPVRINCY